MMKILASWKVLCLVALLSVDVRRATAVELTFELPDKAKQCFHDEIEQGTKCTLEFQVISGGNYDVDVALYGPGERMLQQKQRKQYDAIDFEAHETGEYYFCFSNEFSTFAHKVVYLDFIVGDEVPITEPVIGPLTQLESSMNRMHEALKIVRDYQTHHRLREAQGRDMGEYLNERVQYWSLGETLLLVLVGLGQVFILRWFFAEKRSNI